MATDLSHLSQGAGPREAAALKNEIAMMAQTRELALRAQVHAEHEARGQSELIGVLGYLYGHDDDHGKRVIELEPGDIEDAKDNIQALALVPSGDKFAIVVTLKTAEQKADDEAPYYEVAVVKKPGATYEQVVADAQAQVIEAAAALFVEETPADEEPGGAQD